MAWKKFIIGIVLFWAVVSLLGYVALIAGHFS